MKKYMSDEEFKKFAQQLLPSSDVLRNILQRICVVMQSKQLEAAISYWNSSVAPYLKGIIQTFKQQYSLLQPLLTQVAEGVAYAKKVESLNQALADYGWFIPPLISQKDKAFVEELHSLAIKKDDPDRATMELISWCDKTRAREIIEEACKLKVFDVRRKPLYEALEAYLQGKYYVAIPVFLAQSEGAFKEVLENAFGFSKLLFNAKSIEVYDKLTFVLLLEELALAYIFQSFGRAICEQFAARVITKHDWEDLKAKFKRTPLSRHAILHGLDTNYGSQENAVKALFILDVVRSDFKTRVFSANLEVCGSKAMS